MSQTWSAGVLTAAITWGAYAFHSNHVDLSISIPLENTIGDGLPIEWQVHMKRHDSTR